MKTTYILFNTETGEEMGNSQLEPHQADLENRKMSGNLIWLRWFLPEELEGMRAYEADLPRLDNPHIDEACCDAVKRLDLFRNPKAKAWDDGWMTARNNAIHRSLTK